MDADVMTEMGIFFQGRQVIQAGWLTGGSRRSSQTLGETSAVSKSELD
jgi:hypothetical protein